MLTLNSKKWVFWGAWIPNCSINGDILRLQKLNQIVNFLMKLLPLDLKQETDLIITRRTFYSGKDKVQQRLPAMKKRSARDS